MKKIEELFKHLEEMSIKDSTVEERHEIWKLLFEKNLIYNQQPSLESEKLILGSKGLYFDRHDDLFVIEFISMGIINVSFKEFKDRLAQL